jgi:hypothetical protein
MLRGALAGLIDFARIVLLRTASDFDRAPPGIDEVYHLTKAPQGGFQPALRNILLAGRPFVDDVVNNSVPKLHVRDLFGRVRPRTWRFEDLLDWTFIICEVVWTDQIT